MTFGFPGTQAPLWILAGLLATGLIALLLRRLERRRAQRLHLFTDAKLAPRLLVGYDARIRRPLNWLTLLGCVFLILTLFQPRWGKAWVTAERGSRDILVLLDTSESMNAADLVPNRLERARQKVDALMRAMPADRFGIVAFSGAAILQCPLTLDHAFVRSSLNAISTDTLTEEGTDIAEALRVAKETFAEDVERGGQSDRYNRAIVLISDGEQVTGDAVKLAGEIGEAAPIFVMGIGDPEGEQVLLPQELRSSSVASSAGTAHVSRLDEKTLSRIAIEGAGLYVRTTPTDDDVQRLVQELEALQSRAVSSDLRFSLVNRYRWPLSAAVLCFMAEGAWLVLMPLIRQWRLRRAGAAGRTQTTEPSRPDGARSKRAVTGKQASGRMAIGLVLATGLYFATSVPAGAASVEERLNQARELLTDGRAQEAMDVYRELQVDQPDRVEVLYGLGCAQYEQGKLAAAQQDADAAQSAFKSSEGYFQRLLDAPDAAGTVLPHAAFNRANAVAQRAKVLSRPFAVPASGGDAAMPSADKKQFEAAVAAYRDAIAAYEDALDTQPDYDAAARNLDHVRFELKKLLQHPPQEQPDEQQDAQKKQVSLFTNASTELPNASAEAEESTARLVLPNTKEAAP